MLYLNERKERHGKRKNRCIVRRWRKDAYMSFCRYQRLWRDTRCDHGQMSRWLPLGVGGNASIGYVDASGNEKVYNVKCWNLWFADFVRHGMSDGRQELQPVVTGTLYILQTDKASSRSFELYAKMTRLKGDGWGKGKLLQLTVDH